jgi:hypothetical protein
MELDPEDVEAIDAYYEDCVADAERGREEWLDEQADAKYDYELADRLMTDGDFYDRTVGF